MIEKKKINPKLKQTISDLAGALGDHMRDYATKEQRPFEDLIHESYKMTSSVLSIIAVNIAVDTCVSVGVLDGPGRAKDLAEIYLSNALELLSEMEIAIGTREDGLQFSKGVSKQDAEIIKKKVEESEIYKETMNTQKGWED